jgi:hypothetical protein
MLAASTLVTPATEGDPFSSVAGNVASHIERNDSPVAAFTVRLPIIHATIGGAPDGAHTRSSRAKPDRC